MSSRGRGYGGYGGRGGRGSSHRGSYRGGGGSRGSYDNRGGGRGGGSYSYENRYNGGGDRYGSSRERMDDSYKKMYRSESSSNYSGRDYGRSGSPERKRMRLEGSSSDRRSHDGGGHYGGSYSNRQDSYSSDRRSFSDERRRSPSREGYRKSSVMGPPRSPAVRSAPRSRISRAPRRSLRGRPLRTRGSFRGALRSRGSFTPRRFGERPVSYTRVFRSTKTLKARSSIKSKADSASSTEEDWDAEEKEAEEREEKKEVKIKSSKQDEGDAAEEGDGGEDGGDTDKEGADAGSDEATPSSTLQHSQPGRQYIKLFCVHCKRTSITFTGYEKHLTSASHYAAMTGVARRHKAQLLRMRLKQRAEQRQLEAAASAQLAPATAFCLVCRLNHRSAEHAHDASDAHRAIKRFLAPYCRVCRLSFRTPMAYEHHICSLQHIKRKARQPTRRPSPKAEASGDEGMDVDLDNFMTLDSVGDVDEVDDDDSGGEKKDEDAPKKPKVEINIGSEHIKKLEVWWCELCRVYLPRADAASAEEREALRRHCRLRIHLGRYVQHRDTRTLRKHAERIHRQLHQQRDGEKEASSADETKVKPEKSDSTEEKKKSVENGATANDSGTEDKMWADVDKDIGDLLREVDPTANDASDDEDILGRYDKFRKSDKKKTGEEDNDESVTEDLHKSASEIDTAT